MPSSAPARSREEITGQVHLVAGRAFRQMMMFEKLLPVPHLIRAQCSRTVTQGAFVSQCPEQGFPDKLRFIRKFFELFDETRIRLKGYNLFFLSPGHYSSFSIKGITL
jgi:hypothetical protein